MADLTERMRDLTELLMPHFAPRNVSYYRDALFFVTTSLHRALPDVSRIIMLDIDMSIHGDIAALDDHFDSFSPAQVMRRAARGTLGTFPLIPGRPDHLVKCYSNQSHFTFELVFMPIAQATFNKP